MQPSRNQVLFFLGAGAAGSERESEGLGCRIAKGLNKLWQRRGKLFLERFHSHVLRTRAELYHGLRYVLNNHLEHRSPSTPYRPDLCSSGDSFDGWFDCERADDPSTPGSYVSPPASSRPSSGSATTPPIPLHSIPGH